MPTYNRPERLVHALRQLQKQHDSDWEALVIDDGDGSGYQATVGLADERIRAFYSPGKHQVDARNSAISYARGEVIAWLDDDDWWEHPEHLVNLKQALLTPALVHVYGWIVYEDDAGEQSRQPFELPASAESLWKDNTLLTSSIAYPKAFHRELGLLDRSLNGYFDWDWILRVLSAGYQLKTIKIPSVCYLRHQENGSNHVSHPRRRRDFNAFCDKHGLDLVIKNHALVLDEASRGVSGLLEP